MTEIILFDYTERVKISAKAAAYPLLLIFFLTLAFIAGYFVIFYFKQQPQDQIGAPVEDIKKDATKFINREGDPIRKYYNEQDKIVEYSLMGKFVDPQIFDNREENALVKTSFIVSGDPLKRQIPVYVGSGVGKLWVGVHEGGFKGKSEWKWVPFEEFTAKNYKLEEEVLLKIQSAPTIEEVKRLESVLDTIGMEYVSEDFKLTIPQDFYLVVERIGVVK